MPDNANDLWPDLLDQAIGSPPGGGPDPQALVAAGRRSVRRRRLAASAGTAAATVAVLGVMIALRPGGGGPASAPYASEPTAPASTAASDADPGLADPTPSNDLPIPSVTGTASDQVVVGPAHVTWGPDGLVATEGGRILEQRSPLHFKDFAGPGERTAAAEVRTFAGATWYVVAREGAEPQFINVVGSTQWASLDEFVQWAKERYRRGEGLL